MTMTWKELKEYIDEKLKSNGVSEDAQIEYIDIRYPDNSHPSTEVTVHMDDGAIYVCN